MQFKQFVNILLLKIPFNFHLLAVCVCLVVYKEMSEAMNKHPDADVMINFASLRSAYDATLEAMQFPQVKYWVELFAASLPWQYIVLISNDRPSLGVRAVEVASRPGWSRL